MDVRTIKAINQTKNADQIALVKMILKELDLQPMTEVYVRRFAPAEWDADVGVELNKVAIFSFFHGSVSFSIEPCIGFYKSGVPKRKMNYQPRWKDLNAFGYNLS